MDPHIERPNRWQNQYQHQDPAPEKKVKRKAQDQRVNNEVARNINEPPSSQKRQMVNIKRSNEHNQDDDGGQVAVDQQQVAFRRLKKRNLSTDEDIQTKRHQHYDDGREPEVQQYVAPVRMNKRCISPDEDVQVKRHHGQNEEQDSVDQRLILEIAKGIFDLKKFSKAAMNPMTQQRLMGAMDRLNMIERVGNVNAQNETGNTLLHIACIENVPNAIQRFVSNGADPRTKNSIGDTPLHALLKVQITDENREEIFETYNYLVGMFPNLENEPNNAGITPLMLAAPIHPESKPDFLNKILMQVNEKGEGLQELIDREERNHEKLGMARGNAIHIIENELVRAREKFSEAGQALEFMRNKDAPEEMINKANQDFERAEDNLNQSINIYRSMLQEQGEEFKKGPELKRALEELTTLQRMLMESLRRFE